MQDPSNTEKSSSILLKMSPSEAKRRYGGRWLGSVLEFFVPAKDKRGKLIPNHYVPMYVETYKKKEPVTPADGDALNRAQAKRERKRKLRVKE